MSRKEELGQEAHALWEELLELARGDGTLDKTVVDAVRAITYKLEAVLDEAVKTRGVMAKDRTDVIKGFVSDGAIIIDTFNKAYAATGYLSRLGFEKVRHCASWQATNLEMILEDLDA